jgi:hypothetical protein
MKEILYGRRSWDCQYVENKTNQLISGAKSIADIVKKIVICKERAGGT